MFARTSFFSAFAVLLLTSTALSQSIPIPNYDFASPYVANLPPYAVAGFSSWVQSPPPAGWTAQDWEDTAGVFVNVPSEWIDNLVLSGGTAVHQQGAFMFATPGLEISQQLTNNFQVGTSYQLTVGIQGGGYGMAIGCPMEIELYYLDGSGNQVPVGTTTILNDLSLSGSEYITHLPDWQLTIPPVAASAPWAGQNIGVALLQTSTPANEGGYWDIDNVRLMASITSTAVWTGAAGDTNWSSSGNWTGGVPNAVGAGAVFSASATGGLTVTLDAAETVGTVQFCNSGSTGFTLSGAGSNTLTLSNFGNGASIFLVSGSHTIDAPVVLADNLTVGGSGTLAFGQASSITDDGNGYALNLNAAGTLILSSSDSYGGGTTVTAGTLIAASDASLPAGSGLTVGAGGAFIFDSEQAVAQPASAVAAVPEPGTFALLAVGVVAASLVLSLTQVGIYLRRWSPAFRRHFRLKADSNRCMNEKSFRSGSRHGRIGSVS